jgi:acetylglutamate kinase
VIVIKLGGAALKSTLSEKSFFQTLANAKRKTSVPFVVVHGGGPEINAMAKRLGLTAEFFEGQRITDSAHLEVVEQILSGKINPTLVRGFLTEGISAFGLSGVDGGLFECAPEDERLGLVGHVKKLRAEILHSLLDMGTVPVVSPVGLFSDFTPCNVNADLAAAAIAAHLKADRLLFLTDKDGILDAQGSTIAELSRSHLQSLIDEQAVSGGMKVKARAILETLARHPNCQVSVMNGLDWGALEAALSGRNIGTRVG